MKPVFYFTIILLLLGNITALRAQHSAPILQCVHNVSGGGVEIAWTDTDNCGANFVATHIFVGNDAAGPFTNVQTLNDPAVNSFIWSNPSGGMVYVFVQNECTDNNSYPSDTISNAELPPPQIIRVEVLGGKSVVEWEPITLPNVFGYIVYGDGPVPIDTLYDPESGIYQDTPGTPNFNIESYTVSTIDSCLNSGTYNPLHSSIYFEIDFDTCTNVLNMSWTAYKGWAAQEYIVYKIDPSNGFSIAIDTVAGTQLTYTYTADPTDPYRVFSIKAVGSSINETSNSNRVPIIFPTFDLPQYIYCRNATVTDEEVNLEWYVEAGATPNRLIINRGTTSSDLEKIINLGSFPLSAQIAFVDNGANPQREAYYYNMVAEDKCGSDILSEEVRTMFLTGNGNFDYTNTIYWNKFEIPYGTVQSYRVWRDIGNGYQAAGNLAPNDTVFTDNISDITLQGGAEFCYRIEAIFELNLPTPPAVSEVLSSFSNDFCIGQNSRIFMPNAFRPNGGVTPVFKPLIQFANYDDYSMIIFNRWGEILFQTSNPDEGWDGTANEREVPQDVYSYIVRMKSLNGLELERKGTVLLLR